MADIDARRTAEPLVRGRLERQDGQHAIDIVAHGARPPGPPGPDRRRNIIEDGDRRRAGAHAPRDPVGEIRAIDDDQRVRARGDDGVGSLANAPQNHRQPAGMALKPMMARSSIGNGLTIPAAAMARPPMPASFSALPAAGNERANERGAKRVAGFFGGDEIDRQRSRPRCAVHRRASPPTPTKKILARSAAALTCAGSAIDRAAGCDGEAGETGTRDILDCSAARSPAGQSGGPGQVLAP